MCWRSHVTKSRVVREEVGSRRRGEGRKKCSFFSVSVLSVGTVPATLLQNALIMPYEKPSLKGLCCLSLCPFVSPTVYLCIWASILTRAGTVNLRAHSRRPRLTHLRCYRRSKWDVTMERSAERGMSVGMEERVEQIETERGGGREARGDRRHFHISRLPDLPLPLFLVPRLSLLLRLSHSLSCSLCFSIISLSLSSSSHSHHILRGHSTKEDGQQFDSCWGCHMSVLTRVFTSWKRTFSPKTLKSYIYPYWILTLKKRMRMIKKKNSNTDSILYQQKKRLFTVV